MQSYISIDHESRHNSYRADDAVNARSSEETPLLHRFPSSEVAQPRTTTITVAVTLLLIILISGVVIGIYLLILQSNSENILPPVRRPLQLVSSMQWDHSKRRVVSSSSFTAQQAVVLQTDTLPCYTTDSCVELLEKQQTNVTEGLPYNFLVSSTGQTYEALGWRRPSPLFPQLPTALVLAFIGNFTEASPSKAQVDEALTFFAESVSLQKLHPSYSIVGKNTKYTPTHLFRTLEALPQWNKGLSDPF